MPDISDLIELSIEGYPSAVRIGAGGNAFASVQTAFEQPAVSASIDVHVDSSRWCVVGQWVYLEVGGSYTVASAPDQWHVRLVNMGLAGNAAPAAVIDVGAKLTPSGIPGVFGGSVTEASVRAALAASAGPVSVNSQPVTNVARVDSGANELLLQKGGANRLASEGTNTIVTPGAGGNGVLRDENGVHRLDWGTGGLSAAGNALENLSAGGPTSAALQSSVPVLSSTPAQSVGTANAAGASSAVSRVDHTHALTEGTFRTIAGSVSGPTSFNGQNVTGIANLGVTSLSVDIAGAINVGGGVWAQIVSGAFVSGNNATNQTIRGNTLIQFQTATSVPMILHQGYVGLGVAALSFEPGVVAPVVGQVGPASGDGAVVTYCGQVAGAGNNKGGQGHLTNGTPTGTGLRAGSAMGLRSTAGALTAMVSCREVAAGVFLVAEGQHATLGTQTDPGPDMLQVTESGAFGTSNPPAGCLYVRRTATRYEHKDSSGVVRGVTLT